MPSDQNPSPNGPEAISAPWRDVYMRQLAASTGESSPGGGSGSGCFLSEYWRSPDGDGANHVIARVGTGDAGGMIVLNRYPYANGHLLVALGDGRASLTQYAPAQQAAFWGLMTLAVELVETTLAPQGVNIGINQGAAAGAGVPQHLHGHVVPRWNGDVNFITVVGQIRVIPSALESMAERYRERWAVMRRGERSGRGT